MIRPLEIYPVLNGFVAKIGCQLVAFIDKKAMVSAFERYLDDPDKLEAFWLDTYLPKKQPSQFAAPPNPCPPPENFCERPADINPNNLTSVLRGR